MTACRWLSPSGSGADCDECGGALVQRPDDRPETIRRRLAVFRDETQPVLAFYAPKTGVTGIDGDRPIEAITEDIRRRLVERASAGGARSATAG